MNKETLFICKKHKHYKSERDFYKRAGFEPEPFGATNYLGEPIKHIGDAKLVIDKRRCVVCRGKRAL